MSSRVTRSSARLAADTSLELAEPPPATSRKRKASGRHEPSPALSEELAETPPKRRTKRQRVTEPEPPPKIPSPPPPSRRRGKNTQQIMSNSGSSTNQMDEPPKPSSSSHPSKRRSSKTKKSLQEAATPSQTPATRRTKKRPTKREVEVPVKDTPEPPPEPEKPEPAARHSPPAEHSDSHEGGSPKDMDDDDMDDPFRSGFLGGGRGGMGMSLQSTLRQLSGVMSGTSSKLREILNNLRLKDDPDLQRFALEDLSNLLLVSNEDTLSGQFSPDPYVKELVTLMQPPDFGEENPDIMLLACRCIANLMEALRGSVANVVYGGAVPVLCQKLLDISYIDLAEQALSTLSKISVDFPASIVREGGLTACLQFLDFFPTGTQRTAVTTAANCCRNIPQDSFPVIRDVMPILLNVLSSHDQKVVEQGCLCVTGVIDSFKHKRERLEELVQPELLQAILRLLLPGTTNLIGPNIHTQFLRVLGIVARISPNLSVELLKMNVVDTLYQILTGVSPPSDTDDAAMKIDSVVVMQALIHRPREQVFETLNVICELLSNVPGQSHLGSDDGIFDETNSNPRHTKPKLRTVDKRAELLNGCKAETKRFAMILLPTLTDAYSSTVNLSVRQKVLTAQLKMLSSLDNHVIEDALRPVPYASFLASILSQQDHSSLVRFALQASELLLERLESIYQYQFYREGVIAEIKKLADAPLEVEPESLPLDKAAKPAGPVNGKTQSPLTSAEHIETDDIDVKAEENDSSEGEEDAHNEEDEEDDDDDDDDEDDDDDVEPENVHEDESGSDSSSSDDERRLAELGPLPGAKDLITLQAKAFIEKYEVSRGQEMHDKATKILNGLQSLSREIEECYLGSGSGDGTELFSQLASHFDGDALESITTSELLNSGIIRVLVEIFSKTDGALNGDARTTFIRAFMGRSITTKTKTGNTNGSTTAFSVLVYKLQDLLSRAEHFEVLTVNHGSSESSRNNATSMLSKQLRLKLMADGDSDIPRPYKDVMVSIHAIATFKALDDYLRPRISLSERPGGARHREAMLSHLASARLRERYDQSENSLFGAADPSQPTPPDTASPASRDGPRVSSKSKPQTSQATEVTPKPSSEKPFTRRSNRRQPDSTPAAPVPPPDSPAAQTLECADERQLSEEEDLDEEGALNAIIDDLDDELDDDVVVDPTAVNMEIATSGKVTARKEDGTRVATPQQISTPTSKPSASTPTQTPAIQAVSGNSLALAGRPFSYAAALASVPQDWHIEFSIDDRKIPNETTIYRAVYHNREQPEDPVSRNIWSGIHTIKFKRVKGPPAPESVASASSSGTAVAETASGMPPSLDKNSTTSTILRLLKIMHELNANLEVVLGEQDLMQLTPEPLAQFINTKLTAKMNRQLEEPLIVASNCMPSWSEDLSRLFSFLFPFETRHLYLQSTSFGYSRSMMRWQSAQSGEDDRNSRRRDDRPFLGRLQRQKVRIARTRILESAVKVMELYGASPSVLEVEYFEEVGTGLGPTLEFYSTVSKEFSKKKLQMWRENDSIDHDEYAYGKLGLFPAPMSDKQAKHESGKKLLHLFKMLGKFVARAMLDSRIIDVSFNPTFFRIGESLSASKPSMAAVKFVDRDLANSLWEVKQFAIAKEEIEKSVHLTPFQKVQSLQDIQIKGAHIEDLGLDFTLPGYPAVDLISNGSNVAVTIDNVGKYVDRVLDLTLGSGVERQLEAFRSGFSQVFSYASLRAFTPSELVMLFGRVVEDWTIETLMDSIKADHGFNMDSKSVRNLLQTMSELSGTQRRDFLQFVTGSPKLPIGGFKSLTPMFTVVCRPSEPPYTSDDYLPSVMTCVNYLKLPDYTDLDVLRKRLNVAIQEGQGAFHLS